MLALFVAGTAGVAPAAAQLDASLGLGVGTVRYPAGDSSSRGATRFSSTMLSPGLHASTPRWTADLFGSVASLSGGTWSLQGRADIWAATAPLGDGFRLGAEGILAGTTRTDSGWTAAAHGIGELLWSAPKWGVGLGAGPSAGWSSDISGAVTALHTRARLWWRPGGGGGGGGGGGTDCFLAVEPTRFGGAWFTDITAGATLERGSAILSVATSARFCSSGYCSKAAGSAFLQVFVSPSVSVELGGGGYLNDPYQGLPRASLVTLGVRLHGARRIRPDVPTVKWTPLVLATRGDSLVVRFDIAGAGSVAIAGDWDAWRPRQLRPVGDDVWEGTLVLRRGLYHFNLLVDGAEWVVPKGVATVSDGLGGMVGVLLVP